MTLGARLFWMWIVAVGVLVAVTACDSRSSEPQAQAQTPAQAAQPSDCTPVMTAQESDYFQKEAAKQDGGDYVFDNPLAIDCIIMTAPRYASAPDASSVVAKAVITACQPRIVAVDADIDNHVIGNDPTPEKGLESLKRQQRRDQDFADSALRYVIEARTLHCQPVRPAHDVEGPPRS